MSNNLLDSCLDSGGVDIVDNYVRALAAETQSDGLPDTMRGPCHDHNFVAKASLHLNHLVSSFLLIAYCRGYIPNSVGTGGGRGDGWRPCACPRCPIILMPYFTKTRQFVWQRGQAQGPLIHSSLPPVPTGRGHILYHSHDRSIYYPLPQGQHP